MAVPRVECERLSDNRLGGPSTAIRARVQAPLERQARRFAGAALLSNADVGPADVRTYCALDDAGRALLRATMIQLQKPARASHRSLKLVRTIASLAGSERMGPVHPAAAIQNPPRRMF